ncbi:dna recombination protein rmuc [hydrocarbon metagenome]|uniref:Dna recombination protein rmuc n=1 Tax=hydrocarbon metagenome TaxID=938273 RepID=A0A0W8FWA4_9ZZZZ
MEIIYLVIGLLIGSAAAYIIAKYKYSAGAEITIEALNELKSAKIRADEKVVLFHNEVNELKTAIENERKKFIELNSEHSKISTQNINLAEKLENQKKEIEQLQERFRTEFKNIANEILEDKSRRFTEQNQQNLKTILDPLRENISDFRKRVDEIHAVDNKSYSELSTHLKNLQELNIRMSEEAENLTKALKGDTKVMGSWGEFVLESILQKSGLVKDDHYSVQESFTDETGKRLRPDIIIKLPDQKCIIIDSKVSLVAYEKYSSAENETEKERAVKEHIISMRGHIKGLSAKEYQNIAGLNPPDFVLMFVPIEPAFSLAVQKDPTIFNDAFENNIVIVSPSTLLATLRTIENIWRRENQNKNALEIARRSGALYDKFVGFVEDLDKVGERINQADSAYRDAKNKLSDGRGNILRSIQSIKELGAKASKSLDNNLLESADE